MPQVWTTMSYFAFPSPLVTIFVSQDEQLWRATVLISCRGPFVALSTTVTKVSVHIGQRWAADVAATVAGAVAYEAFVSLTRVSPPFSPRAVRLKLEIAAVQTAAMTSFWKRFIVFIFYLSVDVFIFTWVNCPTMIKPRSWGIYAKSGRI